MGLARSIWHWVADRRLGFIVFGCLALGLAGVVADWLSLAQALDQNHPLLGSAMALLAKVGPPLLGGGVAGGFLKLLATEGYFLDAVRGVVFGPEGVTQMDVGRRIETWRRLTAFIYVPVDGNANASAAADQAFRDNFTNAVDRACRYDERHFVRGVERELTIRWDPARGAHSIAVEDLTKIKVIPFEQGGEVLYTMRRKATSSVALTDYNTNDRIWINKPSHDGSGRALAPDQPTDRIALGNGEEKLIYRLSGRNVHDLTRHSVFNIDLSRDPIYEVSATLVMDRISVTLVNEAKDLTIKFYEFGWQQQFRERFGRSSTVCIGERRTFETDNILLPNQGYALIFERALDPPVLAR